MVASEASMAEELEEKKQQKSNCIISLPLSIPPFVKPQKSNLQADFHNSIVSTAENCLRFLNSLVVSHPLFNKVLSFSSHFQHFCQLQLQRRTYQNMGNLSHHSFAAVLPGDSVAGIVAANGVLNFLNIYNTLLVVRLVLTWFPSAPQAVVSPLSTLCDPYLNIFRGIIPPLGGTLDLSPILAFLVLNAFTSAATALPAELPSTLTTSQKKWMTRLSGNKPKTADGDN